MKKSVMVRFLKIAFRIYPTYFYTMILIAFVNAGQLIFGAFSISLLMEVASKQQFEKMVFIGIIVACVEALLLLLNRYGVRLQTIQNARMHEAMGQEISKKIMSLPFAYLEMPYYLELKKNAEMGIYNMGAIESFFTASTKFLSSFLTLLGLGSILFHFDPWLVVVLFAGILLTFVVMSISKKTQLKFYQENLPINFKFNYYFDTLLSEKNGKDFRFYSHYDLLKSHLNLFMDELIVFVKNIENKMATYDSLISAIRYVQMFLVYSMVAVKTLVSALSISEFTLSVSSALSFSDSINSMIMANNSFQRACEYVKPFLELMELEDETNCGSEVFDGFHHIVFDHVSFKYPNSENLILDDVSFEIKENEKISIVGLNGAGKTTIVKLICRLYAPTSGRILVNGKDIWEYELNSYIDQMSSVFQDFKMFALDVYENVGFHVDHEKVEELLMEVGVHEDVLKLKNGYHSILSKSFDEKGVDMSGGQMQKIAIARALAKKSSLLILDEPTSALDPISEAQIYENFNRLSENKTALYISHRMSSSIFCDRILVLDHGRVCDFDSHVNLMKKKEGLYYQLFSTQAENYRFS